MLSNYKTFLPEYLVNLIHAEEECARSFQSNRNMKNKLKYRIIQEALKKVFNSWYGFTGTKRTIILIENFIKKLIPRAERHRLSFKVGTIPDSQIKYEATQSAIIILLDIYSQMENESNDTVLC